MFCVEFCEFYVVCINCDGLIFVIVRVARSGWKSSWKETDALSVDVSIYGRERSGAERKRLFSNGKERNVVIL